MLSAFISERVPTGRFGDVHPRYMVPDFATLVMGGLSMASFAGLTLLSQNVLDDTILALGLCITFYYALTAFSCVILYRHQLLESAGNLLFMGLLPLAGGVMMTALFAQSCISLAHGGSTVVLGLGGPLVIGLGALLLGLVPLILLRLTAPAFFKRA